MEIGGQAGSETTLKREVLQAYYPVPANLYIFVFLVRLPSSGLINNFHDNDKA